MIDPPETFQREKRRTYQRKTQKTPTGTQTKLFNLLPSMLVRTANKRGEGSDEAWRLLPLVGFCVCICMRAAILNYYAAVAEMRESNGVAAVLYITDLFPHAEFKAEIRIQGW